MPPRVVKVSPLPRYRLHVEFDDGVAGTIDLSGELDGEVFQPLRGRNHFSREDASQSAIHALYPFVCGHRNYTGRNTLEDCFRESPPRLQFARVRPSRRYTPARGSNDLVQTGGHSGFPRL